LRQHSDFDQKKWFERKNAVWPARRMVRVKIARIEEPLTFGSQSQTLSLEIMEWPQNRETPALNADGNHSFDVHKCASNRPLARIGSR
jgi:hypothetical protein